MAEANIVPFLFEGDNLVRSLVDLAGDPWFVAMDVCAILGIKNASQAVQRLDDDEKGITTNDTPGGSQELLTVSESGLYALAFKSRKPQAKRFRKWVTSEVLPTLRKTGTYTIGAEKKAEIEVPTADLPPYPEWPLGLMREYRQQVEMYGRQYGTRAAQWLMPQLGFPIPPRELIDRARQLTLPYFSEGDAA